MWTRTIAAAETSSRGRRSRAADAEAEKKEGIRNDPDSSTSNPSYTHGKERKEGLVPRYTMGSGSRKEQIQGRKCKYQRSNEKSTEDRPTGAQGAGQTWQERQGSDASYDCASCAQCGRAGLDASAALANTIVPSYVLCGLCPSALIPS
jgi:hypothetical protein